MTLYDFGTGGFDLEFYVASLTNTQEIIVCSDIAITDTDAETPATAECFLVIEGPDGNSYDFTYKDKSNDEVDRFMSSIEDLGLVRIVFHNEFCSVYVDHKWIYTFAFAAIYHPEEPSVGLKTNGDSIAIYNIRLKELSDWREAIFIDLETSTRNAIQSAILQRPVDNYPNYEGKMKFVYDPVRETRRLDFVRNHREVDAADVPQGCSDALVYFTYAAVVNDLAFAESTGFVTRLLRLPNLDNGAVKAARILQRRARQSRKSHSISARIDPRIEPGDIVQVYETLTGTGTVILHNIIVESARFSIREGQQAMSISGRDADE